MVMILVYLLVLEKLKRAHERKAMHYANQVGAGRLRPTQSARAHTAEIMHEAVLGKSHPPLCTSKEMDALKQKYCACGMLLVGLYLCVLSLAMAFACATTSQLNSRKYFI